MLKLTVVLLAALFIAATDGFITAAVGGYSDRPELLEDPTVVSLTMSAVEHLALTQDLVLKRVKITRVQTQIVAGVNYKIDFTGEPFNGRNLKLTTCQALIYVRFDSTKQIQKVQCSA
jgi:hypothetical protein